MIIKKVLNSSVVLVNDNGVEKIALGKGIGYGRKVGEEIEVSQIDKIFQSVNSPQGNKLLELMNEIPLAYFGLATEILNYTQVLLNQNLSTTALLISLTDHIHFSVERAQQGLFFNSKVYWEIKSYYSKEFQIGLYAVELINKTFNVNLPEEEAANIAFHLINAEQNNSSKNANKIVKLISDIETVVKYSLSINLEDNQINYQRFVTHTRFFAERFFNNSMLSGNNKELFNQVAKTMPEAMKVAEKVQELIENKYSQSIPIDELTYLAIHFQRFI